jgi:outer membrane immunogenic protein
VARSADSSTGSAALGGGQIGANFQYDRFVVGLEGDFDWSGLGNNQTVSCGVGCSGTLKSSLNWLATGRVRAGVVVFDRGLLYGTGGVAVEPLSQNANITIGGATTNLFNLSATGVGWTIGAGVEAAVFGALSAKVEYLYVDVENLNASSPISIVGGTITQNARVTQSIVRGGFNYRFNFSGLR